jgi:hypothetical protein
MIASNKITSEQVALLIARDGLTLVMAKQHARRYAIELTGRDTGSASYEVIRAIERLEAQKKAISETGTASEEET